MLADSDSPMLQMAQAIALSHHEHWDGSGYPNGTSGRSIPEVGRIVAIVDVYDALSHDRVYRKALPENEVLEIIERGRGSHFDPQVVDLFFRILPVIQDISRRHPDQREVKPCKATAVPIDIVLPSATWWTSIQV